TSPRNLRDGFAHISHPSHENTIGVIYACADVIYTLSNTLSLHDALPISHLRERHRDAGRGDPRAQDHGRGHTAHGHSPDRGRDRSEEHTSELQSLAYLVCRLLLVKKKTSFWLIHRLLMFVIVLVTLLLML